MSQQQSSEKLSLFAERLRSRMARLGIQANELAEKIDVSPGAVGNWMSGVNAAKGKNLRKLAEVLKIDPHWFFGETYPTSSFDHGVELRDAPSEPEAELWKRRAKAAEEQLANLRTGLRSLLELSAPVQSKPPVSSKPADELEELLTLAEDVVDSGSRSSLPKPGAAGPSEKTNAPSRGVSGESKVPPAPEAPAPKLPKA